MFCPKCGQQSSDEVRFCPRCGFQLARLAAYLAAEEHAPGAAAAPRAPLMTARRRGMRRGAKVMFFCGVLLPAALLLAIEDAPGPLLLVLTTFLAGLAWFLYSWLFNDNVVPVGKDAARRDLAAAGERPALGAPQFTPAPLFNRQRADTGEIYQPPSVTENTTKLLDKDS
ncbi:MAG TPA: zinc ribbon domain-containing protein [Pyrinomonadaceae bacterium]